MNFNNKFFKHKSVIFLGVEKHKKGFFESKKQDLKVKKKHEIFQKKFLSLILEFIIQNKRFNWEFLHFKYKRNIRKNLKTRFFLIHLFIKILNKLQNKILPFFKENYINRPPFRLKFFLFIFVFLM